MKNVWIGSVAALALACTVGIGAQTTASPATSSNQAAPDTITVTGCLKAADAMGGATGTSGSTTAGSSSTAASSDRFMLANATMGAATTASAGTAGTSTAGSTAGTASSPMRGTGSSYALSGDASELRPHLNHQVEIKGRLDSSASSTASRPGTATGTTATGTTATPATSPSQDASAAKTLRVESVKMIAATCPAQ